MPLISVCIPTFEQPEELRRALESVCLQTFTDFEVVITDDSMTDSVEQVVVEFRDRLPIRYFRNRPSLGPAQNWNSGIDRAEGEIIKMLHNDDWFGTPNALFMFAKLLSGGAEFGFSAGHRFWYPSQSVVRLVKPSAEELTAIGKKPYRLLTLNSIGVPSVTVFRRSLAARFDPNLKWAVDVEFYARAVKEAGGFEYCPEPLVNFTLGSPHQLTAKYWRDRRLRIYEHIYTYRSAGVRDFRWSVVHFWSLAGDLKLQLRDLKGFSVPFVMVAVVAGQIILRQLNTIILGIGRKINATRK